VRARSLVPQRYWEQRSRRSVLRHYKLAGFSVERLMSLLTAVGGDPIRWTVDLSGCVLRSSSEKNMIDVDAVGISRSLRDFQTSVGAFCASTGVAASTSSSTSRKVSMP
jgi:hypothetical protein